MLEVERADIFRDTATYTCTFSERFSWEGGISEDNDDGATERLLMVFYYTPEKGDVGHSAKCLARQNFRGASTNEISRQDTSVSKRIVEESPPLPMREIAVSACDSEVTVEAASGVPSRELNKAA